MFDWNGNGRRRRWLRMPASNRHRGNYLFSFLIKFHRKTVTKVACQATFLMRNSATLNLCSEAEGWGKAE